MSPFQVSRFALVFLSCGSLVACSKSEPAAAPAPTVAEPIAPPKTVQELVVPILARSGSAVAGTVSFSELEGTVTVMVDLTGVPTGGHGFHIHEKGDCSAPDAASAGGHFNPHGSNHGAMGSDVHHAGDLGNLEADGSSVVKTTFTTTGITLAPGLPHSIGGRGIIVHAKADDFVTQPTGNAGGRIGCGVIDQAMVQVVTK